MTIAIKILALVIGGSRLHASTRYRVLNYIPELLEEGIHIEYLSASKKPNGMIRKFIARIKEEQSIIEKSKGFDAILIQKRLFRIQFIKKLMKLGKPIIFDFDDSLTKQSNTKNQWSAFTRRRINKRFEFICTNSNLVFAGSKHLTSIAKLFQPNTVTLPTVVNTEKYRAKKHSLLGTKLAWIGQARNGRFPQFEHIIQPLKNITKKFPNTEIYFISSTSPVIDGLNIKFMKWSEEDETTFLESCDIGISPILDDDYSRGGCCLKAIQYMAAGLPTVCSAIGAHLEIIENDAQGLLVSTPTQWESTLENIITNQNLRQSIGYCGRTRVEQEYSLRKHKLTLARNIKKLFMERPL